MARKVDPEKHDEKRRELLEAARRCFLREGLRGASTAMICKEAGISPGHLYHYFASKELIVEAMAEEYLRRLHGYFADQPEGADTPTVLLSEIWSMRGWGDVEHCRILFELLAEAGRNPRIRTILQENTTGVCAILSQTLRAGQAKGEVDAALDPDQVAAMLVAVVDAAPMLPLMVEGLDFAASRNLLTLIVRRFLAPQRAG